MCGFRGGLELLLEKSTKVHKVDVPPMDDEVKVLLDRMPQGATAYRVCSLVVIAFVHNSL
jgi:hypothetical protein